MNLITYLILTNYYFDMQKDISLYTSTTYGGCYYV